MADFLGPDSVLIVGTGLMGTSIGLALRHQGVEVFLQDLDPEAAAQASAKGAGIAEIPDDDPDIVVLAVPPTAVAKAAAWCLEEFPTSTVTDIASVKTQPMRQIEELGCDLSRFVGGHPMAGRELSGPTAARGDLFEDRLWVMCVYPQTEAGASAAVESLIKKCGAVAVTLAPDTHDHSVALTSHTPQILSSALAAQLADATDADLVLAGQGLRDATRTAASNSELWADILAANAHEVATVIRRVAADLDAVARDLSDANAGLISVQDILSRGNSGHARLPDKHGGAAASYTTIPVVVDDKAGELGRLFHSAGAAGVNLEDVRIEHTVGRLKAIVELDVRPDAAEKLRAALVEDGWQIRG